MTQLRSSISKLFTRYLSFIFVVPILPLLISCTEIEEPVPFKPTSTINKLFIVGSQIDNGDLVLYVNGTDKDGTPFTESDLKTVNVVVGDEPLANIYTNGDGNVVVQAVAAGDKILSLTLLSDYSGSIDESEFSVLSGIYNRILDALPEMYEIQVINFSEEPEVQLSWTESNPDINSAEYQAIRKAVQVDTDIIRRGTALYDSIGYTLHGDFSDLYDGLIQRCRPARMMIAFSDGEENWSSTYTDRTILELTLKQNNVLTIMLGSKTSDLATLSAFAGDDGAVVQMSNASEIDSQITNWKDSLSGMVSVRIKPSTDYITNTVTLRMNSGQEVTFDGSTGEVCL